MWKMLSELFSALTGGGPAQRDSTRPVGHSRTGADLARSNGDANPKSNTDHAIQGDSDRRARSRIQTAQASTSTSADEPAPALPSKSHHHEHHSRGDSTLEVRERELLARISSRIEKGDLELPQLPSTALAVIDMTSKGSADISDIVRAIESDPVLSSEIVKTANSAMYSGAEPVETITASVMRIGMRNLRTLMFSLSMRSAVFRDKRLSAYAEDVWRHSFSAATIARGIAKPVGVDPDRAFLLGLLADIGKVSLLAMLRKEVPRGTDVSQALVGRVFYLFHEIAGARLAEAWHMPQDIIAVAACHHHYTENKHNKQDAALVSLALRLDMMIGQGDSTVEERMKLPEMEFLEMSTETRETVLDAAYQGRRAALKTANV